MTTITRRFEQLGKGDAGTAGGKGASLGEMTQAGIPVPPGFVILTDAFEQFLQEADLAQELDAILDSVNREDIASVDHASEKIQALILAAQMPADIAAEIQGQFIALGAQYVAVRSSATAEDGAAAAWAGQLDTFLNTTEDTLLEKVQHCWASLFTPRAIFYRFEKGMHGQHISVAVVVQTMVQSEVSGIAFSVHPVTEDHNQLIIEAGYGLGEAIVSGQVTPDAYVVEKEPRRIIDANASTQTRGIFRAEGGGNEWRDIPEPRASAQVLNETQIHELSEIILRIERHYAFPCDIEWAFENSTFYITQSRPVTTLSAQEPMPEYFGFPFLKMGRWTMRPLDVENWHTEHTSRYFAEHFGPWKEMLAVMILDEAEPYNYMYIPKRFVETLHEYVREITASDVKGLEKKLLPFYEWREVARREVPQITAADFAALSNEELLDLYRRDRDWAHKIVVFDQFGWIVEDYWTPLLKEKMRGFGIEEGTGEYHDVLFKLIKPHEISSTLEEKRAVVATTLRLKRGEISLEAAAAELAAQWGWMPVLMYGTPWDAAWYEKELDETRMRDETVLQKEYNELERYSEIRDADIAAAVEKYHISEADLQPFIDFGLLIDTRNEAEYVVSICGFYLLPIYAEIARRFDMSVDDLRLLYEEEIAAALLGNEKPQEILARKKQYTITAWGYDAQLGRRVTLANDEARAVFNYVEAHCTVAGADANRDAKKGVPASPGKAQGIARIIPSPSENHRVGQGEILITFATTVDYLPAMKKAAAIVTEVGGLTCHAAVVSREFGIPCVVGLKDAMTLFADGDTIEVDADKGEVRVIEHTSSQSSDGAVWRHLVSRHGHPYVWAIDVTAEQEGTNVGPLTWKYNASLSIKDPDSPLTSEFTRDGVCLTNTREHITEQNAAINDAIAERIKEIHSDLLAVPGTSRDDIARLSTRFLREMQTMLFGFDVTPEVQAYLHEIIGDEKFSQLEDELALPASKTIFQQEGQEIEAAQAAWHADVSVLSRESSRLAEKFGFLHQEFQGRSWTAADYEREIKEYKAPEHVHISVDRPDLSAHEEWLVRTIRELIYMYDEAKNAMIRVYWAMRETLKTMGVDERSVTYMTLEEFSAWAAGGPALSSDDVRAREEGYAFFAENGVVRPYWGKKAAADLIKELGITYYNTGGEHVVRGVTAFKGRVRGSVVIVRTYTDAERVKDGDVLVASMTTPELLAGMYRASAFVTDEGGMTCHAAIIAREMKKPCVVGTRVATRSFADGDLVEVDADRGEVRVLERGGAAARTDGDIVAEIKHVDWYQDWSGLYSQLEASLDADAYFGIFERACGASFSRAMQTFKGETAIGWLSTAEAERVGTHLVARLQDPSFLIEWVRAYRANADTLSPFLALSHEEFLAGFSEYKDLYPLLAPYAIGTKIAFNMLPLGQEGVAAELEAARLYTERLYKDSTRTINELCRFIAERSGYPVAQIRALTADEVCVYAATSTLPNNEVLAARSSAGAMYMTRGSIRALRVEEAEEILASFRASATSDGAIRGTSAYPGTAKGVCRVVFDYRDVVMQEGEILVTPMTNPYFVPLMKKASATVTDGGGMLSHAAIVARELKKPCIIGTKIATQVLKDGDMVEVDADKGIVTIIEKHL